MFGSWGEDPLYFPFSVVLQTFLTGKEDCKIVVMKVVPAVVLSGLASETHASCSYNFAIGPAAAYWR